MSRPLGKSILIVLEAAIGGALLFTATTLLIKCTCGMEPTGLSVVLRLCLGALAGTLSAAV